MLVVNFGGKRGSLVLEVGDEIPQRGGIEHRPGEHMRSGLTRLLQNGNRERLPSVLLLQLREPQRGRQPRRAAADDQDIDFEAIAFHIAFSCQLSAVSC
jgi:hypothetical protein